MAGFGCSLIVMRRGGPLRFGIVSQPSTGSVTLDDAVTGEFTYTAGSSAGSDSFTFRVEEGGLWSAPATVSVTVTESGGGSQVLGLWGVDEGSGSVVADSSGGGRDGVVRGNPRWVAGVAGSALRLDGSGDYVSVPDAAALDPGGPMSVSVWVRPERVGTQYVVKKGSSTVDGYEVGLSSSGSVFFRLNAGSSGNTYRVDSSSAYPSDGSRWMHVVGTFDGSRVRLFVDGALQGSVRGPVSVGANSLPLGLGAEGSGYRPVTGTVDEVGVYGYALSEAEVAALAAL